MVLTFHKTIALSDILLHKKTSPERYMLLNIEYTPKKCEVVHSSAEAITSLCLEICYTVNSSFQLIANTHIL